VLPKINLPPNLAPTQVFFFLGGGCCFQHEPRKLNVSSRGG
jgi:hypothetical protein